MTDTESVLEELKSRLTRTNKDQYILNMAFHLVDALAIRIIGERNIEEIIRSFYEETTHEKPYIRPTFGLLPAKARIILMARDMLNGDEPKLRYMFGKEARRAEAYSSTLCAYENWLIAAGKASGTIRTRTQRANVLFGYLESVSVKSLSLFGARELVEFIAWLDGRYTSVGKSNILYTLRDLFKCPAVSEGLQFDPFGLLTNLHTPKHRELPVVYTREEVKTVLGSINRGTDSGRMLYLVVAFAAVYGLRSGDIRELRMRDIDLKRELITIIQHKTGHPLQLPLTEDIKFALLDYLMNTRPECEYENIFIKHRGYAEPYSEHNHFSGATRKAMIKCGIELRGRRTGLHSLRHALATSMMSDGVPINEIASVLGHHSIQSTSVYIWSDVEGMRIAALEVS